MDAGPIIRSARREAGLTLRALAARAGTSHSKLSAYESGTKVPSVATLDRVVRACGREFDVALVPVPGGPDPAAQGNELVAVLDLAAQVPGTAHPSAACSDLRAIVTGPPGTILGLHAALDDAGLTHVFGGALALARCTERARGTIDIDLNLFLDTTEFHAQVARRARWEEFAGERVPFISCSDLAVFKVFVNRTKDWADVEEMIGARTLDIDRVLGTLVRDIGADDPRLTRLRALSGQ